MWPIVSSSKQKRYSEVPFQVLKVHQDNQVHEVIVVKQDHQVYPVVVVVKECLAKTDPLEGEVLEGNQLTFSLLFKTLPVLFNPQVRSLLWFQLGRKNMVDKDRGTQRPFSGKYLFGAL